MVPYPHSRPSLVLGHLKDIPQWAHLRNLVEADLSHDQQVFPRPMDLQSEDLTIPFADAPAINRLHLSGQSNYPPFGVRIFENVIFAHRGDRFCVMRGTEVDACSTALPGQAMDRQLSKGQMEHVTEMAYCGDPHSPNNPAHYVADQLPRALMLRDDMGLDPTHIYLPTTTAPLNAAIRAALDPAFRDAAPGKIYHVGRLILCNDAIIPGSHGKPFHYCDRALMAEVTQAAMKVARGGRSHGAKIYMSRDGNPRRALINEAELTEALAAHGITSIRMEQLSGADQLATVSQADLIVAPHGGALTSTFVAKPGAGCVELFNPQNGTLHFALMAARAGLNYQAVMGKPAGPDGAWRVDIPTILDAIRAIT